MSRLGAWLRGSSTSTPKGSRNPSPVGSQVDLMAAKIAVMEDAMGSAAKIMNDDIDGAEEDLKKGSSSFHALGLGLTTFMRSVLGFEKTIMTEASSRLNDCETTAWNEMRKAQSQAPPVDSSEKQIYPPGSEFTLVQAEAQIMGAMVAVLHESLTEGIKGFYKLRKAFVALNGIMEAEAKYLQQNGHKNTSERIAEPSSKAGNDEDSDVDFVDAPEALSGAQTPAHYEGHLEGVEDAEKQLGGLTLDASITESTTKPPNSTQRDQFSDGPDSDLFKNPIDIFVHSGANMCFGILLLIISMVPPAFSRLLQIIGFKGDRERGIKMLWQSTRFNNVNGAFAGLMLLGYYNGILSFADILPSDEDVEKGAMVGCPRRKCADLLLTMRTRYPESRLWKLEEARVRANARDLKGAIETLRSNTDSKMRQVTALNHFELSLCNMCIQDYPAMRDSFLSCVELNDWSHALYYYMAGCAELERYRDAYHAQNAEEAETSKRKAEELFRKAPTVAGKKRFMSRPMPFEQFVTRKLQKWEDRSKELGIDLADAVGVSPVLEMAYLWNGIKRMGWDELKLAEGSLVWEKRATATGDAKTRIGAEEDERATADLCRAALWRTMGRLDEARGLLEGVMAMDKLAFKGSTKDDFALPSAHYEMAVLVWTELQISRGMAVSVVAPGEEQPKLGAKVDDECRRQKTEECHSWLDKVAKWEAFLLDARIGMRVQTGMNTLNWYRRDMGWPNV